MTLVRGIRPRGLLQRNGEFGQDADVATTSNIATHGHAASLRLRGGILLWLISWIPLALIFGVTGTFRYVIWGFQFAIGAAGLALAGSVFVATVKAVGWKHAPAAVWHAVLRGEAATTSPA
jgi:hypothetical protein